MKKLLPLIIPLLFISNPILAQKTETYISFDNDTLKLYPWWGNKIVILSRKSSLDTTTMKRLVNVMDSVYLFYQTATGKEPGTSARTYINNHSTISDVPRTCGAGCAYIGYTGIEIVQSYFDRLYDSVRLHNTFDHVPFYEFGRNFWFYSDQLEYKSNAGHLTTGFAIFMRYKTMQFCKVKPAYFNKIPFDDIINAQNNLVDYYLRDTSNNWGNTLALGKVMWNPFGLGATDLFASFLLRLEKNFGGTAFVNKIWIEAGKRPKANTTQDAVDNFILAASAAAGKNLTVLFKHWRWPVSASAENEAKNKYGTAISLYGTPTVIKFKNIAETKQLSINSNINWTITSNASYVTLDKTLGSGNNNISVSVQENSNNRLLYTNLILEGSGFNHLIEIIQDSTPQYLKLSKNNLHFSNIASDQVIQVFNNTDWNTTNSATWLTLSPNNTSGNRNVTISVTANTNSTSRFATVTFTAGDIKQILYIKQDSVTLGVEKQNNLENISIYPNPSNGIFIIDFKYLTGKKIITVYDNKGVLIINTTTENITFPLDLSGFRKGIYSINVLNENNILTLKILNK